MKLLIIEDTLWKSREIEEVLEKLEITYITVQEINSAKRILKGNEKLDGIILDMQLPVYEKERATMKDDGGIFILKWLKHYKYKIPVLGNSVYEFHTDYPYFKGQMYGMYDAQIFQKFLSSIKDHNK